MNELPIIPGEENAAAPDRSRTIVRTSVIGIGANVLLAAFKAVIGMLTHSIAITLDAVNNLSDAASSVITIVGARLAGREPDKKHPFGYGRVEYLSAMVISLIVLYAGITSLVESVKKIFAPQVPDYSYAALIVIAAGVLVKLFLGRYVKAVGKRVNSDALVNSGQDAALDAVISAATLLAAIIFLIWGLSLEAWLGAVISLIIIKSGVEMLRETLSRILGESGDGELANAIRQTVCSFPQVAGAYDLVLHNYGPDAFQGSVHISVPDTCTAFDLDELIRSITEKVYLEHRVILTAIGVYSVNTTDERVIAMREAIQAAVTQEPYIREIHGFYLSEEKKTIRFDLVVSFDAPDRPGAFSRAVERVKALYPDYQIRAVMDTEFTGE